MTNFFIKKEFRVGVFIGGKSIEHEVSFNSSRTVCDHIDSELYDVYPIYQARFGELYILPWRFLHRGRTSDFEGRLKNEAKKIVWDDLKELVDFVYIASHGRNVEDGVLQGMLEVLGLPFLGSGIFSSALGMDKIKQNEFLNCKGINVPRGISLKPSDIKTLSDFSSQKQIDFILKHLRKKNILLPCVVKPCGEGSSLGISVVFKNDELWPAIIKASSCDPSLLQAVLIEEKLEGMEFVCIHIEKKDELLAGEKDKNCFLKRKWIALPITEIVKQKETHFFDYEQKYMPGVAVKITPARCNEGVMEKIQRLCLKVTGLLGFSTLSRIDGFLTKEGKIIIVDSNPVTGMGPSTFLFHQAAEVNLSHTGLINHLIEIDLNNYGLWEKVCEIKKQNDGKMMIQGSSLKIKVVVLLGGDSREREISLESGRNVCYKLSPHKYEVIPVFVNDKMELFVLSQKLLVRNCTRIISKLANPKIQIKWADLPKMCDFVFIALHGSKGENGCVQGTLEMLDLPYNGSGVFTSSLCMDKYKSNDFFRNNRFDVPSSVLIYKNDWLKATRDKNKFLNKTLNEISFPLILKPHDDGCSILVKKLKDLNELIHELENYFKSEKTIALVEECVEGIELTCGVIGNDDVTVLPPSEPVLCSSILSIEEKFLPGAGENQTPANLPQKALDLVMKIVSKAYKAIDCRGYARIDCFYQNVQQSNAGKEKVVILEVNTLPGLTPATCIFHQAAEIGMKPMEFIDKIVELGLENYKKETLLTTQRSNNVSPLDKSK